MSLKQFTNTTGGSKATITVVNRNSPSPIYRLLESLFDDDAVAVQEADMGGENAPADTVLLRRNDSETVEAVSSLDEIRDELLLVNSDLYVTGTRGPEDVDLPDVIAKLDGIPLTVRGSPQQSKAKLVLIEISRHIEAMALQANAGRLATGFQFLSRLDGERGTRRVYARLGTDSDVNTHVYGVPDVDPSLPGVTVHGEDSRELRRTWFVVYEPADGSAEAAALIAIKKNTHTWQGYWTYDPDRVADVLAYLDRTYS